MLLSREGIRENEIDRFTSSWDFVNLNHVDLFFLKLGALSSNFLTLSRDWGHTEKVSGAPE